MINVIGLGYIGLPTALMMASHGVEVIGTDYNKELVATLNAGRRLASSLLQRIRLRIHTSYLCQHLTISSAKRWMHAML